MNCIVSKLTNLLEVVGKSKVCQGNSDSKFLDLPNIQNGVLMNAASKYKFNYTVIHNLIYMYCALYCIGTQVVAAVNESRGNYPSIYHCN